MEKKVMSDYSLYCTQEQALKAIELGAPIEGMFIPTAEQMLGWLEEQGLWVHFCKPIRRPKLLSFSIFIPNKAFKRVVIGGEYDSRPKTTLAAIDAALDYLIKNKKG